MSYKICCVPDCFVKFGDGITLHRFPNPSTDIDRFKAWISQIGGDICSLDKNFVYKNRRICDKHFATFYHGTRPLTATAMPSVEIPATISMNTQNSYFYNCPVIKDESDIGDIREMKEMGHDYSNNLVSNNEDGKNNMLKRKLQKNSGLEKRKLSIHQELEGPTFLQIDNKSNILHVGYAVEVKSEDLDIPAMFRVCRICLAIDVKMYRVTDSLLSRAYQQLTGIMVETDDQLPKAVCWECCGRLLSSQRLRDRALAAHNLMVARCSINPMSIKDVKSIDRSCNNLDSTLGVKLFEDEHSDMTIRVDEETRDDESDKWSDEEPEKVMVEEDDDKIFLTTCNELASRALRENKANRKKIKSENVLESNRRGAVKHKNMKKSIRVKDDEVLLKNFKRKDPVDRSKKIVRRRPAAAIDTALFSISRPSHAEQLCEVQRRKETASYRDAPYKCDACCRAFRTRERYDDHALRHSESAGAYACAICAARFPAAGALRDHLTRLHREKYSCNRCPFTTYTRFVARRHQNYHAGVKHQCPHCQQEFGKVSTYMSHVRIKHPSRFVCELCGFAFINQRGVDVHKYKKHARLDLTEPLSGPYCGDCDIRFLSAEAYARHLKLSAQHGKEGDPGRMRNESQGASGGGAARAARDGGKSTGAVTCEECDEVLGSVREYTRHRRSEHGAAPAPPGPPPRVMCDQCGKTFQSSGHLASHMWVHTGVKRFQCATCSKRFTNKRSLQLHAAAHGGAAPSHDCPVCGRQFTFRSNKRRHMLIHTGLKPFKCDTCGKCFKTEAERRSHVDHVHLKVPWPKRSRSHAPRLAPS